MADSILALPQPMALWGIPNGGGVENVRFRFPVVFHEYFGPANGGRGPAGPGQLDPSALPEHMNYQQWIDDANNAFRRSGTPIRLYWECERRFPHDNDADCNVNNTRALALADMNSQPDVINVHVFNTFTFLGRQIGGFHSPLSPRSIIMTRATPPTTFIHEIGHLFGLLHTHQFTEYGAWFPMSEPVTRGLSFCQGWIPFPFPRIAPCAYKGDFICGTQADPEMSRNFNVRRCQYTGGKRDCQFTTYRPNTNNAMAYGIGNWYTNDPALGDPDNFRGIAHNSIRRYAECGARFESGQNNVMIAMAQTKITTGILRNDRHRNVDVYEPDNDLTGMSARDIEYFRPQFHTFENGPCDGLINNNDRDNVDFFRFRAREENRFAGNYWIRVTRTDPTREFPDVFLDQAQGRVDNYVTFNARIQGARIPMTDNDQGNVRTYTFACDDLVPNAFYVFQVSRFNTPNVSLGYIVELGHDRPELSNFSVSGINNQRITICPGNSFTLNFTSNLPAGTQLNWSADFASFSNPTANSVLVTPNSNFNGLLDLRYNISSPNSTLRCQVDLDVPLQIWIGRPNGAFSLDWLAFRSNDISPSERLQWPQICNGRTGTLTVSASGNPDNITIVNTGNASDLTLTRFSNITYLFTANKAGFLPIRIEATNACGTTSANYSLLSLTNCTQGGRLEAPDQPFSLYPNPTDNNFFLSLDNPMGLSYTYTVRTLSGQTLLQKTSSHEVETVQTADWSPGIYLVEVIKSDGTVLRSKISIIK